MTKQFNIHIINNSHISKDDMSGGEKIAMELARKWAEKSNIFLYTSNLGIYIWNRYKLDTIKKVQLVKLKGCSSVFNYFFRAIKGTFKLGQIRFNQNYEHIIYSASDFWPDSVPAFIVKLRNPAVKWIAGFYMFAPKPWQKDSPYRQKRRLIGLMYWLTQLPIYYIVKEYADYVFVTSEPDVKNFLTKKRGRNKIVVVRGGVDAKEASKYLNSSRVISVEKRKYDAVFVGRFHYQKGASELIDIWKLVCEQKPQAKLAMVGIGPLEDEIRKKIKMFNLENDIELLGFKDGEEKYEIFKQSKIVVHPATYDSGGMAACEAMAWGLPGVSFDLEALKTYYPKGMVKTPCYDLKAFAEHIIKLLDDKQKYEMTQEEAIAWAKEWDWDKRAEEILRLIQ